MKNAEKKALWIRSKRSEQGSFPRKIGVGKGERQRFCRDESSSALSVVRSWAERRGARRRV